nr:hypothetical protein JVH1_8332 [Rhodococcus sp. JVH1]
MSTSPPIDGGTLLPSAMKNAVESSVFFLVFVVASLLARLVTVLSIRRHPRSGLRPFNFRKRSQQSRTTSIQPEGQSWSSQTQRTQRCKW